MADNHTVYLAKTCIKRVQNEWGKDARRKLGPVIYEALVAREALGIVTSQAIEDATDERKARAAEFMQEVCNQAMALADA